MSNAITEKGKADDEMIAKFNKFKNKVRIDLVAVLVFAYTELVVEEDTSYDAIDALENANWDQKGKIKMKYIRKIKKWIIGNKIDILVYTSFLILSFNTLSINVHAGFYLIAVLLLITAFIASRFGGQGVKIDV